MPELPSAKRHRFSVNLGLSAYDSRVLTDELAMAQYFEEVVKEGADAKSASNWITGDMAAYVNSKKLSFSKKADIYYRIKTLIDDKSMGKIFKVIFATSKKINFKTGFTN